jgi:hypothetical protein
VSPDANAETIGDTRHAKHGHKDRPWDITDQGLIFILHNNSYSMKYDGFICMFVCVKPVELCLQKDSIGHGPFQCPEIY